VSLECFFTKAAIERGSDQGITFPLTYITWAFYHRRQREYISVSIGVRIFQTIKYAYDTFLPSTLLKQRFEKFIATL